MTIAMLLLFSTRTAPVLQAIIVQMAPDMLLNFPVHWVHSVTFLVFPMSHNVLLVLGATTAMNLGKLPSLSFATKVRKMQNNLWGNKRKRNQECFLSLPCIGSSSNMIHLSVLHKHPLMIDILLGT